MSQHFISICIPAFKRVEYLARLLDSVKKQRFRDFEVIITDDSPAEEVRNLAEKYRYDFELKYSKNASPLGTPENWNAAIRQARGEWIKLMHDDDWFRNEDSL